VIAGPYYCRRPVPTRTALCEVANLGDRPNAEKARPRIQAAVPQRSRHGVGVDDGSGTVGAESAQLGRRKQGTERMWLWTVSVVARHVGPRRQRSVGLATKRSSDRPPPRDWKGVVAFKPSLLLPTIGRMRTPARFTKLLNTQTTHN